MKGGHVKCAFRNADRERLLWQLWARHPVTLPAQQILTQLNAVAGDGEMSRKQLDQWATSLGLPNRMEGDSRFGQRRPQVIPSLLPADEVAQLSARLDAAFAEMVAERDRTRTKPLLVRKGPGKGPDGRRLMLRTPEREYRFHQLWYEPLTWSMDQIATELNALPGGPLTAVALFKWGWDLGLPHRDLNSTRYGQARKARGPSRLTAEQRASLAHLTMPEPPRPKPLACLTNAGALRAAAGGISALTHQTWPRERLDMLWRLNSQSVGLVDIAAVLNAEFPDAPSVNHQGLVQFLKKRRMRRGDPIPDPTKDHHCYLYRDIPAHDGPPDLGPVEWIKIPWEEIEDWARRQHLIRRDDQNREDWLRTVVNPRRRACGVPLFIPNESQPWERGWRGWRLNDSTRAEI